MKKLKHIIIDYGSFLNQIENFGIIVNTSNFKIRSISLNLIQGNQGKKEACAFL